MITANDGRVNLDRALPETDMPEAGNDVSVAPANEDAVLTHADMLALARTNLQRALQQTDGRISGKGGAAELLGVKPSTLSSRVKALGLQRP